MPSPSRRSVLAGTATLLGAGLAGCIGAPRAEPQQAVTASAIAPPDEAPLTISTRWIEGWLDDGETPPTIELTITNPTADLVRFGERRKAQLYATESTDSGNYLLLHSALTDHADGEAYEFADGCWRRTAPVFMTGDFQIGELDPGETLTSVLYLLVNDQESDETESCPDDHPATIEFTTTVGMTQSEPWSASERPSYDWGVRIER